MKKNITRKRIFVFGTIIFIIIFLILPHTIQAINPDDFKPGEISVEDNPAIKIAKPIVNAIAVIGTIASVITLIIIGIKYMTGSVEEKAEYKKSLVPYLIGALLVFGITGFLKIIVDLVARF